MSFTKNQGTKSKETLQNYTSGQIKAFIDNDNKYELGVKLDAVYQLSKGNFSKYEKRIAKI
ncbi:hypothetical protein TRIP_D420228 [uncultured Paludibacter sp.]|uniref:Uncharacterized protein n=1 Tax=uncultured Paludibacter sp. TaxID=497635 RepID=A0A653AIE0_9BACT|nr:hypothetical protein TRIP_D420228 [uncultured Paludibacter sp.]